jgi:hypothetical protein
MAPHHTIKPNRRSLGKRKGKKKSSNNGLNHGFIGRNLAIPGEDAKQFDAFRSNLIGELSPNSALEHTLAETIVADAWRLRRIPRLEAALWEREERKAKLEAARSEMRAYETSPLFDLVKLTAEEALRPRAYSKHKAAKARLQELERTVPSIVRFVELLETHRLTFSNLNRYESALARLLTTALLELQHMQIMKRCQRVPVSPILERPRDVFEPIQRNKINGCIVS